MMFHANAYWEILVKYMYMIKSHLKETENNRVWLIVFVFVIWLISLCILVNYRWQIVGKTTRKCTFTVIPVKKLFFWKCYRYRLDRTWFLKYVHRVHNDKDVRNSTLGFSFWIIQVDKLTNSSIAFFYSWAVRLWLCQALKKVYLPINP